VKSFLYKYPINILLLFLLSSSIFAIEINDVNLLKNTKNEIQIVFDLDTQVTKNIYKILVKNKQVIIDFYNTELIKASSYKREPDSLLVKIQTEIPHKNDLRLILELKKIVKYSAIHENKKLIINLIDKNITPKKDIIIAIDAGHGGIDPGATGYNGTHEKNVVLKIAKTLANLLNAEIGIKAILTRKKDNYLKLRKRINYAREYQADLFISIHADAYKDNKHVKGSSVYILSNGGASDEAAEWLANKENSADLLGGINLSEKDDILASVLLGLSQEGTLEASAKLGQKILLALDNINHIHHRKVQQANFMVLRSPDIPSILIETAFISNPIEESNLNDDNYRYKLTQAIKNGIQAYLNIYSRE
jgi:N-acetylmuramoyl-L-alanine amidase